MLNPEALNNIELTLESRIDIEALRLCSAATPDERRVAWGELKRLHAMRSPERIEEMETAKGIRR